MRAYRVTMLFSVLSVFVLDASLLAAERAPAADAVASDDFLPPLREAFVKKVGPSSCMTMQNSVTIDGRAYRRIDIGLNGSVDGYVAKTGAYKEYLTNVPDLVFPQTGNPGPLFGAVASYERDRGAAITMPSIRFSGMEWKAFHHRDGRNRSFKEGTLKAWDKYFD